MKPKQPDPVIAVLGVGQLGSRYVQGLLSGIEPLDIWLQDPAINSKSEFDSWRSTYGLDIGHHSVRFSTNSQKSPDHFDLVISATTAGVRYKSLNAFLDRKTFDYLILEKLLTTNLKDLEGLAAMVQISKECWVNHPMRLFPHYQQLKTKLHTVGRMEIVVEGTDWNLASNSSHYIDFVRWLTGEKLVDLDCSVIDSNWKNSKRQGYLEFTGLMKCCYSEGSELFMESRQIAKNEQSSPIKISIRSSFGDVIINEGAGIVQDSLLKEDLQGKYWHQSELTSDLVSQILNTGQCGLPKFQDIREDHAIYLNGLRAYQQRVHFNFSQSVRIT